MSGLAKALAACRSIGAAAAGPSVTSSAKPSSTRSTRRGGCAGGGRAPGGAGDLKQVAGARQMPGEECRLPRVDVGLAGQVEVERLEPLGRLQQQRGSVAAQAGGERDPARAASPPGRAWNSSSGPAFGRWPGGRGPCRTRRPARWPARRPACARRVAPGRASARPRVPGTRRRRPGRRGPAPGRRSVPAPRRPARPGPAAASARCQARRSGSAPGSVTAASAACARRRAAAGAA